VFVHDWTDDELTDEPAYGVRAVRLPRMDGVEQPYEGGAWVEVAAGTTMTRHVNPDGESEIFFLTEGTGTFELAGETHRLTAGATVSVPPHTSHSFTSDPERRAVFLSLWWGAQPAQPGPAGEGG
jgi:quercetin dioxygenase-like cupin family protein